MTANRKFTDYAPYPKVGYYFPNDESPWSHWVICLEEGCEFSIPRAEASSVEAAIIKAREMAAVK